MLHRFFAGGPRRRAGPAPLGRAALALAALSLALGVALLGGAMLSPPLAQGQFRLGNRPMPEFTNRAPEAWINSAPISRSDLAGKVVLIEIWTSV